MWRLVFSAGEGPGLQPPVVLPQPPKPNEPPSPPPKKKPVSLTVQITPTRGEDDDDE